MSKKHNANIWIIVPAAGAGRRMGSEIPKQYLQLNNKPVISHVIRRLADVNGVKSILIGLAEDDPNWQVVERTFLPDLNLVTSTFTGGKERADTVLNGLNAVSKRAHDNDWVMVHDAARPCVRLDDISGLMQAVNGTDGGLLAIPVADTVKRADTSGYALETVPRDDLWRALTPQVFRYGQLKVALQTALDDGFVVTDEASAMEHCGFRPLLFKGHADNIKITHPEDLKIAEMFLSMQMGIQK